MIYLEKIYELRTAKTSNASPMAKEELLINQGMADTHTANWYKRVIGSILYASVISRLDIAFVVLRLARFINNLGEKHIKAAN